MEPIEKRLLLRPGEAAAALGVSRSKLYELLSRRAIPSIRIDGSIRVPAIQLSAWIEAQMREQAEAAGR